MTDKTFLAVRAVEAERRRRRRARAARATDWLLGSAEEPCLPHGAALHGVRPPFWKQQQRTTHEIVRGQSARRAG